MGCGQGHSRLEPASHSEAEPAAGGAERCRGLRGGPQARFPGGARQDPPLRSGVGSGSFSSLRGRDGDATLRLSWERGGFRQGPPTPWAPSGSPQPRQGGAEARGSACVSLGPLRRTWARCRLREGREGSLEEAESPKAHPTSAPWALPAGATFPISPWTPGARGWAEAPGLRRGRPPQQTHSEAPCHPGPPWATVSLGPR